VGLIDVPYIVKEDRAWVDPLLKPILENSGKYTPGILNYIITKILLNQHSASYSDLNQLIGVLECCKLEFYRRMLAPYEEKKIAQNGDVAP